MRTETNGNRATVTFDSMGEMIDAVDRNTEFRDHYTPRMTKRELRSGWYGPGVRSIDDAIAVAREGMPSEGLEALELADTELAQVEQETPLSTFNSFYDVSGADVDVARFLSGEPECMVNYTMTETPKQGRVVTLVNSIFTPVSTSADAIIKRGRQVVSLAMAIERAGFSVELWADLFVTGNSRKRLGRIRTMVKAADAPLDAGDIMFAFTHPSMLRVLGFGTFHNLPPAFARSVGAFKYYGYRPGTEDVNEYPDGAILLPALGGWGEGSDIVRGTLRTLGIIE